MAALMMICEEERVRRPRIFRDRTNPMEFLNERDIVDRYRMPRDNIYEIVRLVQDAVESPTMRSHAIPPLLQVLVALRYYAKGDFYSEVADLYGISRASVSRCVMKVSDAISERLDNIHFPATPDEVRNTKRSFYKMAQFPNVLGAVDGTLIPIIPPKDNENEYVCRKGFHSLNIQAVVDHEMRFINIVVKFPGSVHDAFIFNNSELSYYLENTGVDGWLLGDSGYPLKKFLMTPKFNPSTLAEQRYNRAHSKTRVVVERAFGVCKSRFRCLHKTGGCLPFTPKRSTSVVTAVLKLHSKCVDDKLPLPDVTEDLFLNDDNTIIARPVNIVGNAQGIRERLIQTFT